MNPRGQTWACVDCGKPTGTLHEIEHGTADRAIALRFHVQVPLCAGCHANTHAGIKSEEIERLLAKHRVDEVQSFRRAFRKRDEVELKEYGRGFKKNLAGWEI